MPMPMYLSPLCYPQLQWSTCCSTHTHTHTHCILGKTVDMPTRGTEPAPKMAMLLLHPHLLPYNSTTSDGTVRTLLPVFTIILILILILI